VNINIERMLHEGSVGHETFTPHGGASAPLFGKDILENCLSSSARFAALLLFSLYVFACMETTHGTSFSSLDPHATDVIAGITAPRI
jgi:hypothetical protein